QVKTVDQGHYKEYDQTIAFYQKQGFKKLEVFPTLWDEWNPCLVLVKKLNE
ncbi:MAG: N-acetyltransferase, partial [Alkalibacterium sp.]|nr:N-acetyltransferase [Alkalibacterium sp.]